MKYSFLRTITLGVVISFVITTPVHAKRFQPDTVPDASRVVVLYDNNRIESVPLSAGETMNGKIAELRAQKGVRTVAPNYFRSISEVEPNDIDTQPSTQYHQRTNAPGNIKATKAWSVHKGKKSVIAVIDTGVDLNHEDLSSKIWKNGDEISNNGIDDDGNGFVDDVNGWDFFNNNNDPNPNPCVGKDNTAVSHGSHVAGLAAAKTDNNKGIAGIGWKSKIMPLQVSGCDGLMSDQAIAEAIQYATANGADVINLSLGGIGRSSVMEQVIGDAIDAGVIVVAAAGNESINIDNIPYSPAGIDGVITVAATNAADRAANFSNFGSNTVDIAAPGVDLLSSVYEDGSAEFSSKYDVYSGTSMATPVVAGALALARGQDKNLTPAEAKQFIQNSADDVGMSSAYGAGRLNAVQLLLQIDSVKSVHIKAFNNKDKDKKFKRGSRQKNKTPYFQWVVPTQLNDNIREYCVYFGTNKEANPFTQGTCKEKPKKSIDELNGANGKNYYLRVGVRMNDGSQYHKTGTFKYILDTKIKPAPELQSLKKTNGSVELKWKKSSDKYVTKYQIMRKKKGGDEFKKIDAVSSDLSSYTDTTAKSGKEYIYKVKAFDKGLKLKKSSNTKSIAL